MERTDVRCYAMMVVGVLALIPFTGAYGIYGFVGVLFFLLLVAFAKK